MSWQHQILRVNLTELKCSVEPLNEELAQSYLGQRGLGSRYLYEEVDPRVDPVAPENKLIFATGPLTGTMASTGGRYSVITKGALTNAIACSNSGGQFGAELKLAGYDLLILEGRAPEPVYLHIENERARLLPAGHLWGRTVWETEERIKHTHQDPLIHLASVGPSAEYGCRFACVVNDMHRAAGRSGVGTVMASKHLKSIAVRGTKGLSVANPEAFMQVAQSTAQAMREDSGRKGLTGQGTIAMMDTTNVYGSLPTRNFREVQFEGRRQDKSQRDADGQRKRSRQPHYQQRLFRLHHRLRAGLSHRPGAFQRQGQAAISRRVRWTRIRNSLCPGFCGGGGRHRCRHLLRFFVQRIRHGPHLPSGVPSLRPWNCSISVRSMKRLPAASGWNSAQPRPSAQ